MKKMMLVLSAMLLLAGFFIGTKLYIPQSPIEHLTSKEILHTLNSSNEEVIKLTKVNNLTWYITKSNNKGSRYENYRNA